MFFCVLRKGVEEMRGAPVEHARQPKIPRLSFPQKYGVGVPLNSDGGGGYRESDRNPSPKGSV